MKQAKFALTAVAVLAVIGGALAFKASRLAVNFYTDTVTTTAPGGQTVIACKALTTYKLTPDDFGDITLKASTTTLNTPCPIIKVRVNG